MSKILDGKLLSKQIKDELKFQVDILIKSGKKVPHPVSYTHLRAHET